MDTNYYIYWGKLNNYAVTFKYWGDALPIIDDYVFHITKKLDTEGGVIMPAKHTYDALGSLNAKSEKGTNVNTLA